MNNAKKMSVYEFSDHIRVAIQLTYLISTFNPAPELTLYIRDDCRSFMSSSVACKVQYRNKYFMTAQFFFEVAVLGRKVLLTTGPEASSGLVKLIFSALLRILKNRISIFIIVRDLKKDKGKIFLSKTLYSSRSVLAVESDALFQSTLEAGYKLDGYIYPTPITYRVTSYHKAEPHIRKHNKMLIILITGSLDATRRNYEILFESLSILKKKRVPLQIIIGGHCMNETMADILKCFKVHCDYLVAKEYLTDAELDSALISADAIVCLNRPDFYGDVKGSGAIGDSFLVGKSLLIHKDLITRNSADSRFYTYFTSAENLSDHLLKAYLDEDYLRIEQAVLDEQVQYFSKMVSNWLTL